MKLSKQILRQLIRESLYENNPEDSKQDAFANLVDYLERASAGQAKLDAGTAMRLVKELGNVIGMEDFRYRDVQLSSEESQDALAKSHEDIENDLINKGKK